MFGRTKTKPTKIGKQLVPYQASLSTPILQLSGHRKDFLSLNSLTTGVHITGSSGSGKTTIAAGLALAMLNAGYGGIVLSAKPGEYQLWQKYAHMTGRSDDLIRFAPNTLFRFNFLDYAIAASKARGEGMITMNIVSLLMKVVEAAQRGNEMRGQGAEQPFWRLAPQAMLDNAIAVIYAAYGTLRLSDIVNFILTVPRNDMEQGSEAFRDKSFHMKTMRKMVDDPTHKLSNHDVDMLMNYWKFDFGRLDEKTRSNIVQSMTAQLNPLLRGFMHDTFCTETTIVPDLTFTAGSIIVIDYPVKTLGDSGLLANHIMKFLFQQCVEARNTDIYDRPVMLWSDENHYFSTPYDIMFQTTARSARVATICLTQSYSNYYAVIGGTNPRDATAAYLNNFNVKIFLANTDNNTNMAAVDIIGKNLQLRNSFGQNAGGSSSTNTGTSKGVSFQTGSNWSRSAGGDMSVGGSNGHGFNDGESFGESLGNSWGQSTTRSEQMDYEIQAGELSALKTGADNGWHADALVIEGGRRFAASGRHYLATSFPMILL